MSSADVIRAWKDEEYRNSLSDAERAVLPQNPAGLIELTDSDLTGVDGATSAACVTAVVTVVTLSCSLTASCYGCGGG